MRVSTSLCEVKQIQFLSSSSSRERIGKRNMSPSSSSSNDIVLTSSPEGPITAYNATTGAVLARFTGTRSPRRGLALVPNTYIAASHISSSSTTSSTAVHLYNWWSSTALHRLPLPEPVAPLAASPDGSYIFAGGLSGNIHSLSVPSGDLIASFPAHPGSPVSCLEISPDWSLIVSGGDDGRIAVFPIFQFLGIDNPPQNDMSSATIRSFTAHDGPVTAIFPCIGISNPTVVSCSIDSTCKLWSLLEGTNLRTVPFPCPISGIALDSSETDLYAAGSDGSVYHGVLKHETRKTLSQSITTLPGKHPAAVVSIALVNGGKGLVSAAEDGSVHVREVETGEVVMAMGNSNLESISEMVVAKGGGIIGDGGRRKHGYGGSASFDCWGYGGSSSSSGLPGKEICAVGVKETGELEKVLSSVMEDRSKAIDMLESAVEVYGSLLELVLKEANRGSNNSNGGKAKEQ